MANTKNNQRFRANERRLEDAAMELMEKGEKLSVRAVCERAHLNRSTFYAHFLDIPDMVEKLEDHLGLELLARYQARAEHPQPLSAASFIPFLEHIQTHRRFYRVALELRRSFPLKRGQDRMMAEVVRPLCLCAGIADQEQMMCLFVFFQAGFTMVLRRWVEDGCREPIDRMAATIAACVPHVWHEGCAETARERIPDVDEK